MEERTVVASDVPSFPTGAGGEATQVLSAPSAPPAFAYGDQTQQAITVTCPVCQTPNGPAEQYCQDCGLLFATAPTEIEPLPDPSSLPRLVDASGRELVLNPGVNSVGREGADVLVPDPTVSRRHAQLTLEGGQVVVEDLGSTNGTYVAGAQVRMGERGAGYSGDTIKFGSVSFTLTLPGGAARTPDAAAPAAQSATAPSVAPAVPAADRGPAIAHLVMGDGTEFPLYQGVNSVGRRAANEIVLPDAFASGKHAEVTCTPDGMGQLIDLGSTNGSFMAGERLAPHTPISLADGAVVTLGKTPLTYRVAATAAAAGIASTDEEPVPWDLGADPTDTAASAADAEPAPPGA